MCWSTTELPRDKMEIHGDPVTRELTTKDTKGHKEKSFWFAPSCNFVSFVVDEFMTLVPAAVPHPGRNQLNWRVWD
jgi:hypothetical protein